MAVLQMQRISICAMKKNRKAILEELQSIGVLEIDAAELDPELKTMDTMNARLIFEKNASLCDQAIEILDEFSKEKQSMLASLAGKPLIGRKQEEEAIRDQEEILRTAREIQGYRKKLTENSAAAVKLEQQEAALVPWLKLDIPMNFGGTAKAAVLVGSIDGNITLDQVYSQLSADAPQLEAFDIREISNDAGKLSLVVVCLKAQAQELEEALRMQGFARPAQLVSEVPAQELENLKNEVVRIQEESEQIREQICALHGRKSSLQLLSDYFRIRAQKYEVLGQLRQSESTFFVTGYLPKKQVPQGAQIGDKVEVFVYKDSSDRLISPTARPKLQVGECAILEVKDVGKIGAFLDMGLEKDLLLPFKEQSHPVRRGEKCLVCLYVDKSSRLAATMKVYSHMSNQSPYKAEDWVEGTIYEINEQIGAFVAVDNRYYGLIPKIEMYGRFREGDQIKARVMRVREDGKLDLCVRERAYVQMGADAEQVLKVIDEFDGVLPFNDKARPETILREFNMSKNAFKRAVGRLLKEGKIEITEKTIRRI